MKKYFLIYLEDETYWIFGMPEISAIKIVIGVLQNIVVSNFRKKFYC